MKLILLLLFIFVKVVFGSSMIDCPDNTMRVWTQSSGYSCMPRFVLDQDQISCLPGQTDPLTGFPEPLYQSRTMPWWAYQGDLHYPNLHYPGAWSYPHILAQYYSGTGEVFAAKPNVYVESIHQEKKFDFRFVSEEKLSFIVTTPPLDQDRGWRGKIVDKDKFEVDGVFYDYLFYDIRLPKEKMQFEHGQCATREGAIEWMLSDLKEMKYPIIAIGDFEEHWRVKIPDYPFYCIYPQYNRQLDEVLPIGIDVEQKNFIRSLYVLMPFKQAPDVAQAGSVPLPSKDPAIFRPNVLLTREIMFREWGVAFLGQ